mmetsp:Transcript_73253/g.174520  ORF Transcript_73253/g.174520 Transcript_73253/m.174520 type:complete len:469 (+) Transcript_73253:2182-3588(+)
MPVVGLAVLAVILPEHQSVSVERDDGAINLVVSAFERATVGIIGCWEALRQVCVHVGAADLVGLANTAGIGGTGLISGQPVPAGPEVAAIHRACMADGFAEVHTGVGALLLPDRITRATVDRVGATLRPAFVVDGAVGLVWRHPARDLIRSAVHWASAPYLRFAVGVKLIFAAIFEGGVTRARLIRRHACLVVRQLPIRESVGSIGREETLLLIVGAVERTGLVARHAPAETPGVAALLLPLWITGATSVCSSAELSLRSRMVDFAGLSVDHAGAERLVACAGHRAASPHWVPAVCASRVLALDLTLSAFDIEGVKASDRFRFAVRIAEALALLLPLGIARAAFVPRDADGILLVSEIPVDLTIWRILMHVAQLLVKAALHSFAVTVMATVAAVATIEAIVVSAGDNVDAERFAHSGRHLLQLFHLRLRFHDGFDVTAARIGQLALPVGLVVLTELRDLVRVRRRSVP